MLNFSFWRKEGKDEDAACFSKLNSIAYDLISEKRERLASRILEYALSLRNTSVTSEVRLMMIVNQASAFRHLEDEEHCYKILDAEDWSAASPKFRISVAALRSQVDDVVALMNPAFLAGEVRKEDFADWPVFAFIRGDAKFRAEFKKIFKEEFPLVEAIEESEPPSNKGESVVDSEDPPTFVAGKTVH